MQEQEREQAYRCTDYMKCKCSLSPDDRQALCDWGYKAIAACHGINRSTAVIAISYFDRFMSSSSRTAQLALADVTISQLAFVTCLVIALKTHSDFNVEADFVSNVLCKDIYDADDITKMEMIILQDLQWRLNGPTPHDFIDGFLDVIPLSETMHRDFLNHFSKALVELAVTRYSVALQDPSEIAFASVCCVLQYLEAISMIDSSSVLNYLRTFLGLELRDESQRMLFKTMVCLMREFRTFRVDDESFSTHDSPNCIIGG